MSAYALQKWVYDSLHAGQSETADVIELDDYDLDESERRAVEDNDLRGLYQLGVHPILFNAHARSLGFSRNDYRELLRDLKDAPTEVPRWRK